MDLDPFQALDNVPATPVINQSTQASSSSNNDGTTTTTTRSADQTTSDDLAFIGTVTEAAAATAPVAKDISVDRSSISSSTTPSRAASSNSAATPSKSSKSSGPVDLNEELATLLLKKQLPQSSVTALQNLLRENATLKEKNNKLKSLLGRSAKAQRDAKNELESMKKLYESSKKECDRLEKRVEVLANRPTHMDLLADFETNFDRAVLSIGDSQKKKAQHQSGGENAAESPHPGDLGISNVNEGGLSLYDDNSASRSLSYGAQPSSGSSRSDSLLLTELNESKSRIAHLESLNTSAQGRYNNLEHIHKTLLNEQQSTKNTLTNLQLELRMSKMETEHALRSLREKEAIVTEMQLEINLVTQSAVDANKRAAEGMEVAQSAKSDKEYVDGLEAKVVALQEWALASTESKRLTTERCRGLENRVKELEEAIKKITASSGEERLGSGALDEALIADLGNIMPMTKPTSSSASSLVSSQGGDNERKLWTKSSSLVVGAGMIGNAFFELGQVHIEEHESVILRWKFDLTPGDLDIYFSILKGICEGKKVQRGADACFRNRHVKGGGGGDTSGAFAKQNACTLVWSNEMSWVRPRTIKYTVEAIAIEWSD